MALPSWPAHCRAAVPHAGYVLGDNPVVILKREQAQLDFVNTRAANCAAWYDKLEAELEAR